MNSGTKTAGVAALILASCYVFGFGMLLTLMNPGDTGGWSQLQKLEFILQREALFQTWNIVIYVVFGVFLVALTAILHKNLRKPGSDLMTIATPFGFIWAGLVIASGMVASVGISAVADTYSQNAEQAAQLWLAIGVVQNGLGGGVEVVGGIWVLLLSISSLQSGRLLLKALNWLGIAVGVSGIATIVPGLSGLGAVFGLTQILWFLGLGVVLLRVKDARETAARSH